MFRDPASQSGRDLGRSKKRVLCREDLGFFVSDCLIRFVLLLTTPQVLSDWEQCSQVIWQRMGKKLIHWLGIPLPPALKMITIALHYRLHTLLSLVSDTY